MAPFSYDEHGRRVVMPTKGERREAAILDAAGKQLTDVGVEAMTVESIATVAGITRGALYRYFRSRNDVLAALARQNVEALHAAIDQDVDTELPPADVIRDVIARTEAMWREHGDVIRALLEMSPAVAVVRDAWDATFTQVSELNVRLAVRAGLADDDSPTGATAITTALGGMTQRCFYEASRDGRDLGDAAATVLAVWLRSLNIDG